MWDIIATIIIFVYFIWLIDKVRQYESDKDYKEEDDTDLLD